jgi:hypothetical protein
VLQGKARRAARHGVSCPVCCGPMTAAKDRRLRQVGRHLRPTVARAAADTTHAGSAAGAECVSVVHREALHAFALGVLTSIGTEKYSAIAVADGLVEASMRGVDSHGIRLLPNCASSVA